ncbi:hypothetical protein [Granulicella tundricola]|uniref:Uncharacterized protein n=1 Tax=Granulicella tundricola (strain ATCC BAA-1859 / DSM 23138 / MP5ACTX9) TaxID=1198114 RepID=E8WYZ4_GRATM|nr:hypothetical protein [Granulicella tundricola]ADW69909.1 hypothetical protein AciX9_2886 [Granulicella tundricola MP5ACTX9]
MQTALQPDQYQSYPTTQPVYVQNPSIFDHMSDALRSSVDRVLSLLISILPGLLAFILAFVLLTALGVFLSWAFRRILTALKFDERAARRQASGIADWSPSHSPTALVGRIVFWGCVLLGLIIGIQAFDASYATGSAAVSISLLPYVTHSVGAILILFAGNLIARYLARTVLIGAVNNQLQYARFLSMGVKWLVLVLTAAMVLDHLQIGSGIVELAFGILFGGIVLTLALAVGLGSRDLVTRSLERNQDRVDKVPSPTADPAAASESLRHF